MSDKPFARIVKMPDGTSHVIIGDYQSEYYENDSEDVFSDAYKINTAHQAALTAERKRVLEMAAKQFRGRINVTYTPEQVARILEDIRDEKYIRPLSRLEGEGK